MILKLLLFILIILLSFLLSLTLFAFSKIGNFKFSMYIVFMEILIYIVIPNKRKRELAEIAINDVLKQELKQLMLMSNSDFAFYLDINVNDEKKIKELKEKLKKIIRNKNVHLLSKEDMDFLIAESEVTTFFGQFNASLIRFSNPDTVENFIEKKATARLSKEKMEETFDMNIDASKQKTNIADFVNKSTLKYS